MSFLGLIKPHGSAGSQELAPQPACLSFSGPPGCVAFLLLLLVVVNGLQLIGHHCFWGELTHCPRRYNESLFVESL